MNLTREEQETVIRYDNANGMAVCYTYDKSLIRKLDAFCEKSTEISRTKSGEDFSEYTFPKTWLRVKMPRQLSDEQREILAERARKNFA